MPDARHANLLEPEALVELFLRHPPQGLCRRLPKRICPSSEPISIC